MSRRQQFVADSKMLTMPEWKQVHQFLKTKTARLQKSKSEKTIPKPSVVSKLETPAQQPSGKKQFSTLEKQIKEWEVLEHMKQTNPDMFRQFVNQKMCKEDIRLWLFQQGVKQSLADEKKRQLKKLFDAHNVFPFHPHVSDSSRSIIRRIQAEQARKQPTRPKNRTFNERTNGRMIFKTALDEVREQEELEDSWDFRMEMKLNTRDLEPEIERIRKTAINSDFVNLMATNQLGKSLYNYVRKKQNQFGLRPKKGRPQAPKAKSAPRKTMYRKGNRPRRVENKLLNLVGQSRVPENLSRRKDKPSKTLALPVPNRGTIIQKSQPKFE